MNARKAAGRTTVDEATRSGARLRTPIIRVVTDQKDVFTHEIACDFIGRLHGCMASAAQRHIVGDRDFERVYPFGWLGILSETPPALA